MAEYPLRSSLSEAVALHALDQVSKLDANQVLESLREQGIGSLEDLVSQTIESASQRVSDVSSVSELEPWEWYCWKWFIYRPLPFDEIREQLVSQADRFNPSLDKINQQLGGRGKIG